MQTINKTTRPTLVTQIEVFKNYHEHRKRVESTLQRSSLKKSISYDQHKQMLHQYIKNRKQYTNHYNRREAIRDYQMKDSKMLQNILDYDSKLFVFSMNRNHPRTHSTLHHNSIVSSNKKNEFIDAQNEKLHFRISKAKSLYSRLFPQKSLALSTHQFYQGKEDHLRKRQNLFDNKLNTEVSNFESQMGSDQVFTRSNRFQSEVLHKSGFHSRYQNKNAISQMKLNLLRSQFSQPSRKMCERVRRQKLAQKLFEKKQKFQKGILSKIKFEP